jgi:uncharacterized protein with beta-barrel porin domain
MVAAGLVFSGTMPAGAFNITTATTDPVTSGDTGGTLSSDNKHTITSTGSIAAEGLSNANAGVLLNHTDAIDVFINGFIGVLDENSDRSTKYDTSNKTGLQVGGGDYDVLLGASSRIYLTDTGGRTDNDGDGVADGLLDDNGNFVAGAFARDTARTGLAITNALTGNVTASAGSLMEVHGNDSFAVRLTGALTGYLNLESNLFMLGSATNPGDAAALSIEADVSEFVRLGAMTAWGENVRGLSVSADIAKSLQLEGRIQAYGFGSLAVNNRGLGADDTNVLDTHELKISGSSAFIGSNSGVTIGEGLLINGPVNGTMTRPESTAITDMRTARNNGDDVTATKNQPYFYDENRGTGALEVYGSAPALDIDGATLAPVTERFFDRFDDDDDNITDEVLTRTFTYSHGLINRGRIFADGLNDGISATGIRLGANNTTELQGGFLNMGSLSASAYNNNATALEIGGNARLTDGVRDDNNLILNTGSISATVITNTKSKPAVTADTHAARALHIANGTIPAGSGLVNQGRISALSSHIDGTDTKMGSQAYALDARGFAGALNVTQQFKQADSANADGIYLGTGDLDVDVAGATDSDGNVIGDGQVNSLDVLTPSMVGDVLFHDGDYDNRLDMSAGSLTGDIVFGGGTDALTLSSVTGEENATVFTGKISKASGDLTLALTGKSSLVFAGQEATDYRGLSIASLSLAGDANLGFQIDADAEGLTATAPIVNVAALTLTGDDIRISPSIAGVFPETQTFRLLQTTSDLSAYQATINDYLGGTRPFIYNVTLDVADTNNAIDATFAIKSAAEMGLNRTQAAARDVVLAHMRGQSDLGRAIAGFTTAEDFKTGFDQLLPQYGDGTFRQLAALADSAGGAVSQHMRIAKAAGGRKSDGWVQQFGDYLNLEATADRPRVNGSSFGVSFGYDSALFGLDALGLFGQLGWTGVEEKNGPFNELRGEHFSAGLYLADSFGPVELEATGQMTLSQLESRRFVTFGDLRDTLTADWDGQTRAATVKLALPVLSGRHFLSAEMGANYAAMTHDDFQESGSLDSGLAMFVRDGESSRSGSWLGLRGGMRFTGSGYSPIDWRPNYFIGQRLAGDNEPFTAQAGFTGTPASSFAFNSYAPNEDSVLFGIGLSAQNDYFALEFTYRAEIADSYEVHGGGLGVRLRF